MNNKQEQMITLENNCDVIIQESTEGLYGSDVMLFVTMNIMNVWANK